MQVLTPFGVGLLGHLGHLSGQNWFYLFFHIF